MLEVKVQFNLLVGYGDGIFVSQWSNSDPFGNNAPGLQPPVFQIWAASTTSLFVTLLNGPRYQISNVNSLHDYVLEYIIEQYSVLVDGSIAIGPVASNLLPNNIWIGNPVFTWWETSQYWTSFTLSEVQVTVPSLQLFPSTGPVGSKVEVQGAGIPGTQVSVSFDDVSMGTTQVSSGNFSFVLDVPQAEHGLHQIRAVGPNLTIFASTTFVVTSSNALSGLGVALTVGTGLLPGRYGYREHTRLIEWDGGFIKQPSTLCHPLET